MTNSPVLPTGRSQVKLNGPAYPMSCQCRAPELDIHFGNAQTKYSIDADDLVCSSASHRNFEHPFRQPAPSYRRIELPPLGSGPSNNPYNCNPANFAGAMAGSDHGEVPPTKQVAQRCIREDAGAMTSSQH